MAVARAEIAEAFQAVVQGGLVLVAEVVVAVAARVAVNTANKEITQLV
jgi:hypothetical protein